MPDRGDAPSGKAMHKLNPQVNISRPTAARMWLVFFCAFFAVLQSSFTDSGASLFVVFASLISAVLCELLMTYKLYGFEKIRDGSAAASALVLALLLPNQIHPLYAALGAAFAMLVVKHSFGGLGSNWMNPALGGWLFIRFSWPAAFAGALEGTAVPFQGAGSAIDQLIRGFLNKYVFTFFKAELPSGYVDLFSLNGPGIIADRAVFALVLATAVIAAFQIGRSWISFLYAAFYALFIWMAGDLPSGGFWWNGDIIFALFSGGALAAAFFLAADPSSGAKSAPGSAAAAILAAALSMLFRVYASAFYGCFFAVALVNTVTPLICRLERRLLYSLNPAETELPADGGATGSGAGGSV